MEEEVSRLVDRLTLEEKLRLIRGAADPEGTATGYVPGVERLDIPPLRLVDGPLGVRAMGERATAFPSSIALASTWDPDLAREFGAALGREAAAHGQDVVLGPGMNLIRVPHCGRNFEYYSEDPHLTARIGVPTIDGIQSEGVAATAKHYVANNQETNRYDVSADVSERALRELYLPGFRAAVEDGDVLSVMSAYNRVNGTHMSDHERLLQDVLKDEWGFDGVVVSDWWGTRSAVAAAEAGLDLEMPGVGIEAFLPEEMPAQGADDGGAELPDLDDLEGMVDSVDADAGGGPLPPIPEFPAYFGDPLREAIESGDVDEAVVDEKVRRVLRLVDRLGRLEGDAPEGTLDTPEHRRLARDVAVEGSVLLANDGVLPLDGGDSIGVIGPNADAAKLGGGGSSEVSPLVETSPLEGLAERFDEVAFERGAEPIAESSFFNPTEDGQADADASIEDAVALAESVDCAVVVAQDDATEFRDRPDLALPGEQDALIEAVADAAERTVVVLRTSGPVTMPWLESVDAVLETWYPGQADGEALAAVLSGDADPGGRLPVTFGRSADDYPTAGEEAFPGVDGVASYDEGVFVGYRHFDAADVDPLFPFGHGLSYATVEYGDVTVTETEDGFEVAATVRNVGDRAGTEVVQVYAGTAAAPVPCPERELVGFEAVSLEPGTETTVRIPVEREAFAYYDDADGWTVPDGTNDLVVGRSSRDIEAAFRVEC
ncbi:beta-glucosidase [Halopiger goleimassiliensis]|uniref:beta-glucosidase n=1 Tax=Halopiger goleimassiliensis TaxID=1293048 RepID=UPI000677D841|nr:glycoside hydrolase family 3 C-terminal domain-containing protein [Halopiger goleimassiliensis]